MSKEIKTETGEIALKEIEFKSSKYEKISFKDYETLLERYQIELLKLQKFVKEKGLKILILMEGRDAAGNVEKTQWDCQRYVAPRPSGGEITIFDRSWYNRAMVEPVMGFCTHAEHKDFLRQVPKFEELLVSAGIILFKFYFSVSKEEQKRRFESRRTDPLKQYKLSPVDARSQELWNQYTLAKYSMLLASNTEFAPWTILDSNDKKIARLNAFRCILSRIDYPEKIDAKELAVDPNLVRNGTREIVLMEDSQKSEAWRKLESPSRKNKKDKKKG